MWSDLTLSPSFKVKRGQPNLKGFITHLLLILDVCNVKPICRILWAVNLLMSDLTFGPSLKVKPWFTGFGELSFRWIQICIGSPICRSSFIIFGAETGSSERRGWDVLSHEWIFHTRTFRREYLVYHVVHGQNASGQMLVKIASDDNILLLVYV